MSNPKLDETLAVDSKSENRPHIIGARYEILALLGTGGMGNVYKARDAQLDEIVALKVLLPHLAASASAVERFRREVKLARRVTHPNVARVFDLGEHGGDHILTMEFVDGESLGALLRRAPRPPLEQVLEIARGVAAGVGAAHAAGVLHRDLKPDNVLLARDGRVLVTDFGIARAVAEGAHTAGVLGTPVYMAPEQLDEKERLDHRVDIYAFGLMLYEMLVGEPAWKGNSVWAIASARLIQSPPDPRKARADLPGELAETTLKCMQRDVSDRFASMALVGDALASAQVTAASVETGPVRPPAREQEVAASGPVPTTGSDTRVAVLPFANQGPADQGYVAEGLTEDLIDSLSTAKGLRVRSRGTVMRFKGDAVDARHVGRDLGVQAVVEGSVRKSATGYRISARVVSVADGFQLWAKRYDVSDGEILAQNDVIAREIAGVLTADLAAPVRAPQNATTIDLYLRARQAYQGSFSGHPALALELFDQVLALAPDDPRALAGRAVAGAQQIFWTDELRTRAKECAERAVLLAPMLPDAHAALGTLRVNDLDWVGALEPLRRALELAPRHAGAHETLARVLVEAGRPEALAHVETAIAEEPDFEFPYVAWFAFHTYRGETERSEEVLRAARRRGLGAANNIELRVVLWRRDQKRAKELLAGVDPASPRHRVATAIAGPVATGQRPDAAALVPPPGLTSVPFTGRFLAQIGVEVACFFDDAQAAIAGVQRMDAEGLPDHSWLEHCPGVAKIRERPELAHVRQRFAEHAKRIEEAYLATFGRG